MKKARILLIYKMENKVLKCKYAWSHLDFLQGQYGPCFRFKVYKQPIGNMSEMLPSEAINSQPMMEVRKSLQEGVFPPGCFDCKLKEGEGLKSYRQRSLDEADWDRDGEIDYTSTRINKIHDLELKFSRSCNFLCRHCNSESNSLFETVGKKNPNIHKKLLEYKFDQFGKAESPITDLSDKVIEDLIKNIIPGIKHLRFSGGEPLYHLKHYEFLERLISEKNIDNKNISLSYNTNLSMIKFKKYELKDLWKHFKSVHVTVSLDGTGDLFNYFRERGNYDTVIDNIHNLCSSNIQTLDGFLFVCTSTTYHAFYADKTFMDLSNLCKIVTEKYNIHATTRPTFVHTPGIDMVDLDDLTKGFIIDNLEKTRASGDKRYNEALNEIIIHLKGNRRNIPNHFKEIVKLQDKLYNRDPFLTVPRIAEYVYNDKLIWI